MDLIGGAVREIPRLNESPSEKEGKLGCFSFMVFPDGASMKVPPKRKGNLGSAQVRFRGG